MPTSYILALDTTGEIGSLALADGAALLEEVAFSAPDGLAQVLFGEIEALLARHGVTLAQIACFASASGPGSFTGVRVGLTAIKGLAAATGRPAVAVSNLQAIAWSCTGDVRAVWTDARRGEIYAAVYDAELHLIQDEIVQPQAQWLAGLSKVLPPGAEPQTQHAPLARAIAAIAWQQFTAGHAQDPAGIDANYVRRSDAEKMWREA